VTEASDADARRPIVTRSRLVHDLSSLGLAEGDAVMLHASVKSVGWVVGGPDVVLQSIFDVIGPDGTLMMVVGWADGTYEMDSWPAEKRQAYLDECPAYDPAASRACAEWSILTEYLRTWPGACRSAHPDSSFAAVGRLAEWLTADHPLQYGYGPGSPLAKLCDCGGRVLLLGSPMSCVTLLHYSENMSRVPGKPVVRWKAPVLVDGERTWVEIEEYDTCNPIRPWPGGHYFADIVSGYVAGGGGVSGVVGAADCSLFDAADLHAFAVAWLEAHFGAG